MRRLANLLARQQRWQAAAALLTEHLAAAEAASAGGGGPSDVLGLLRLALGQAVLESDGPGEALQVLGPLVGQKRAGPGGVMSTAGHRTVSWCCALPCLGGDGAVSESELGGRSLLPSLPLGCLHCCLLLSSQRQPECTLRLLLLACTWSRPP